MKNTVILALSALLLSGIFACSDKKEKAQQATSSQDSTSIKINAFFSSAAESGKILIQLGKLAAQSTNRELSAFGDSLVSEDSKILEDLNSLAVSKNISLPDSIQSSKKRTLDMIAKKQGAEFDKALLRAMVSEQRRFAAYIRKAKDLGDAEVAAFADRNKDRLRDLSTKVRDVRQEVAPDERRRRDEKPA